MTDDEQPAWQPSKWQFVFVDGKPGEPDARFVGFTMETVPTDITTRFTLTSAMPGSIDGEFIMHGDMVAQPYRHKDGQLYWAWYLERDEDLPYVPDFQPAADH